jgi:ATP-dependent Clp protease protease subunit
MEGLNTQAIKNIKQREEDYAMAVKREFSLNDEVKSSTIKDIIAGILEVNKYDDEQEEKVVGYKREPIKIVVDTFGGHVYDGFGLVATIDSSRTPVHTYCYSKAMSMGFIIFASGHWRFAHPLATFMYHELSKSTGGFLKDIEESMEESRRLQSVYDTYIGSVTNIPQALMDKTKNSKTNWFISATEAKKYGLVDKLLTSKRDRISFDK